eukprot:scaffold386438_cov27-Prasinocladus_malaysianus.AAC.1
MPADSHKDPPFQLGRGPSGGFARPADFQLLGRPAGCQGAKDDSQCPADGRAADDQDVGCLADVRFPDSFCHCLLVAKPKLNITRPIYAMFSRI